MTWAHLVQLSQIRIVHQRTQEENMQFFVVHGRIGFVQVFISQGNEMLYHFIADQSTAKERINGRLCFGGIRQDADEIHKYLFGNFRTGYK